MPIIWPRIAGHCWEGDQTYCNCYISLGRVCYVRPWGLHRPAAQWLRQLNVRGWGNARSEAEATLGQRLRQLKVRGWGNSRAEAEATQGQRLRQLKGRGWGKSRSETGATQRLRQVKVRGWGNSRSETEATPGQRLRQLKVTPVSATCWSIPVR